MELCPSDEEILLRFRKTLRLIGAERSLAKACSNIVILNDKIRGLTNRFENARDQKTFRYNVRIRLAITEGTRDMFYEYARHQAEEIAELRKELYNQTVAIVSGRQQNEDEESEDEYDADDIDFGRGSDADTY